MRTLAVRAAFRATVALLAGVTSAAPAQQLNPDQLKQLGYRHIGPAGNRVSAVVGVAGDLHAYYVGAASGGVWKTTDGGIVWRPVFDDQIAQSIGAIEVAPSDPNVVWVGTGEAHVRSHISIGNGVYKSTDAGATWTHMGLEATGRIARLAIHPTNPDIVFAASQGHSYGPQRERGIYRTTDGGKTWEHVLFVHDSAGASDLAMDPDNPRILYAGFWQIEIHTSGRESGGPYSGIWKSSDGGDTWRRLAGNGLPTRPHGKVALAVAPANSNRIYALIETGDGVPIHGRPTDRGELWRSDDGGATWRLASHNRNLAGRTHYYSRVEVSPADENEVYFLAAPFSVSLDGGATAETATGARRPGGDHHDIWIDPTNADRMIVGHDQGLSISTNRGRSWKRIQLPIAQMYHVTVDTRVPYWVCGNRQDGPSACGPSRTTYGGFGGSSIPRGDWVTVGGGESGWATPDPRDPNVVWSSASGSGSRGGIVVRYEADRRQYRQVEVWPQSTGGWPAESLRYRFVWTAPLTISPHDHTKVYVGSQHVHATTDGGHSWQVISPDLTLDDKSRQGISGGLTPDNIGVEYAGVVFAIAESPLKPGVLWAGTNDGLVHVSRDGGATWANVTRNIPNLPPWGTISSIEASRYDTATAYIAVDFHQVNGRDPFLYKTGDYGRSWRLIVNGIPKSPMSYTHVLKEDPVRRGLLYAGTENALYVSFNDGALWQPLQLNLPHAPVYWLTFQEHFNDLVVGTYGRGFWILDDISPLQQLTAEATASDAYLFELHPAYRLGQTTRPWTPNDDPTEGENPPYGAPINYWLKSGADSVTITILDTAGNAVRTLDGTRDAGINRVYWDLRGEPSTEPRLRTSPLHAPDIEVPERGWRSAPGLGRITLLMPPGTYTVKLSAAGREMTRPLTVRKDPRSGGTEAEIREQLAFLGHLRDDLSAAVEAINRMELVRGQLQALTKALAAVDGTDDVRRAARDLEQKFTDLEMHLYQLKLTGQGQDGVRWPAMLAQRIQYLAGTVDDSDHRPTTQAREVHDVLHAELETHTAALERLVDADLAQFNAMLAQRGMAGVVVAGAPAQSDRLGHTAFPNSGAPHAQAPFLRGVLLLHSFEYERARRAFREAQQRDEAFALACWGEAMTWNHPVWFRQYRGEALAALQRLAPTREARRAKAPTERERAYLDAVEILFGEGPKATRDTLYMEAMRRVHERWPEDENAAAFYALAILGTSHGGRDVPTYLRAAAVVEQVFRDNPRHPGAAHYLIHAYDDPIHAGRGLPAARAYSGIAPDAAHAQHMTTHIFLALGMWDEVISQNIDAAEATSWAPGHYTSWLGYGYLQQGSDATALELLERGRGLMGAGSAGQRQSLIHMRGDYVIATERWDSPVLAWEVQTGDVGATVRAEDVFVHGFAALQRGDRAAAARAASDLTAIARAAARDPSLDHAGRAVPRILELELSGVAHLAGGRPDEGLALLREAAALEDAMPFEFGPPAVVKPTHELLGEALLELGRYQEAQRAFERALELTPKRALALRGLARAAERAGDTATAARARQTLRAIRRSGG